MFKKKDPERINITTDIVNNSYYTRERDGIGIKHCHDNSHAQEDRELERRTARKRLYVVSVICLFFMIGEILGGYFAGSLAVMTDAAHLLVDLTSFIISLCSLWLSSKPATYTLNYGWHRAEILGALLSVFTIWLVTGVLVYLAVERIIHGDYEIEGTVMLITSGCGVLANIIMALTLHQSGHGHSHGGLGSHGHSHGVQQDPRAGDMELKQAELESGKRKKQANASVRAAFVHVVGDLLQSVSVLVSAIIIFFKPEYKMADPICTFLFSIFVLGTTIAIMRDILIVLMEGTPAGVKYGDVRQRLMSVKGVTAVHNLHIWALTMNQSLLSVHIAIGQLQYFLYGTCKIVKDPSLAASSLTLVAFDDSADSQSVLREVTQACYSSYNFHSVTIQMERHSDLKPDCTLCVEPLSS